MNIKLLGEEITLQAPNNVDSATRVRVHNNGAATLLTLKAGATTLGSMTVGSGETVFIVKQPSETIETATAVRASKVGFYG